jgi:aminoglycoside/choline kinase family phosphotransferase
MDNLHDRATARLAWVRAALGDISLTLESASADASFRSYWRTHHHGRSWILMDSPPALEDPAPWLAIGERLAAVGVHVPAVKATDLQQGFLLIEDLGARLYLPELNDRSVDALYHDAMEALLRMQRDTDVSDMQLYDRAFLQRELDIMPEWLLGRHLQCTLTAEEQQTIAAAFNVLLDSALEQPRCFVHRDYHSRNLLIIDDVSTHVAAAGVSNPGIIDFQGALIGPITYDLASLLRDCYIVWDRERVDAWAEGYRQRLQEVQLIDGSVDRERFLRWFDLIGLQRHIKVLGIFCRLCYRDGKPGYLDDLPRVHDYVVDVAGRYPELAGLVALLARCVGQRDLRIPVAA